MPSLQDCKDTDEPHMSHTQVATLHDTRHSMSLSYKAGPFCWMAELAAHACELLVKSLPARVRSQAAQGGFACMQKAYLCQHTCLPVLKLPVIYCCCKSWYIYVGKSPRAISTHCQTHYSLDVRTHKEISPVPGSATHHVVTTVATCTQSPQDMYVFLNCSPSEDGREVSEKPWP